MKKKNNNQTNLFKILSIIFAVLDIILIFLFFSIVSDKKMEISSSDLIKDSTSSENSMVLIKTNFGDIKVELYDDKAPITVKNFLSYVEDGFYEETIFHRVIDDFMIQGGGFISDGSQKETKSPIKIESDNGLKNDLGTIAMARTNNPNSATSQFFINVKDNDFLNYQSSSNPGYTVFGKVVGGMQVVTNIESVQTSNNGPHQDWPVEEVKIISVEIING